MKKGFTLSEVLITLGIIGVVAAMTIPGLITKYTNSRDEAILKEDVSIFQQMIKAGIEEGATYTGNADSFDQMKTTFDTFFLPHIKVAKVCYNTTGCWSDQYKYPTGAGVGGYGNKYGCGNGTISFILYNGTIACIDDFNDTRFGVKPDGWTWGLLFDINGTSKPNVFGKDVFALVLKEDRLLPGGYDMTPAQISQSCSKNGNGFYCLAKVQREGYKLPAIK